MATATVARNGQHRNGSHPASLDRIVLITYGDGLTPSLVYVGDTPELARAFAAGVNMALHGNDLIDGLTAENEAVIGSQIVARVPRLRTGGAT